MVYRAYRHMVYSIQEVAELILFHIRSHIRLFLAKILITFLVIICCVLTPLLLSPSLTEIRSSPLEKTRGGAPPLKNYR